MHQQSNENSRWPGRVKVAFIAFAVIAGFLLVLEHRAHVYPYLPWLLLAVCPLMHLFMHRGHGSHGSHGGHGSLDSRSRRGDDDQPGRGYPSNVGTAHSSSAPESRRPSDPRGGQS